MMADLVEIGCDILTLGQYLQPTAKHLPVARFVHPDEFALLKKKAKKWAWPMWEAGPLVRSPTMLEQQARSCPEACRSFLNAFFSLVSRSSILLNHAATPSPNRCGSIKPRGALFYRAVFH